MINRHPVRSKNKALLHRQGSRNFSLSISSYSGVGSIAALFVNLAIHFPDQAYNVITYQSTPALRIVARQTAPAACITDISVSDTIIHDDFYFVNVF